MQVISVLAQFAPSPEMLPPQVIVVISMAGMALTGLVLWPLARAIARRIEGGGSARLQAEVADLRSRLEAVEHQMLSGGDAELAVRTVEELEERVGFVERLVASRSSVGPSSGQGE